ncbi:MAG: PhzF family phenazine biosynthesis protein [Candidatus Obscuribacterales bacterium]|jgi:trans-2,3-dihydro-3-hydroxyanthranilate isomerase
MTIAKNKSYVVVNAFAAGPFGGNPAAIFTDAAGLSAETMQSFARQLNLVETVFVLPAEGDADFRLRYFTPHGEIPVAGHPTIAAWLALIHQQIVNPRERTNYLQENLAGTQEITIDNSNSAAPLVTMKQPGANFLQTSCSKQEVADVFSINVDDIESDLPIESIDTGLGHLIVPLRSLDALFRVKRQIEPLRTLCQRLKVREAQLFCFETLKNENDLHTRNLCPREGLEDPACGVGSGALAAYLSKFCWSDKEQITLQMEHGFVVNMPSIIHTRSVCADAHTDIFVGGSGIVMIEGKFLV